MQMLYFPIYKIILHADIILYIYNLHTSTVLFYEMIQLPNWLGQLHISNVNVYI